jgi:hypothetical protein
LAAGFAPAFVSSKILMPVKSLALLPSGFDRALSDMRIMNLCAGDTVSFQGSVAGLYVISEVTESGSYMLSPEGLLTKDDRLSEFRWR